MKLQLLLVLASLLRVGDMCEYMEDCWDPSMMKNYGSNDDPEETPGYTPPDKVSLKEIVNLDADGEALVKYKQALLGDAGAGLTGDQPRLTVLKMTFLSEGRAPIELDLTGDLTLLKASSVAIKEGCEYQLKFTFTVANEVVTGLEFQQKISRKGIPAWKDNLMVGSYGPKKEPYEFITPLEKTPEGLAATGKYLAKCKFIDDDKIIHFAWEWTFKIQPEW